MNLATRVGSMELASPLVAAAGTVGSVMDFTASVDFSLYGAAVAKSVSPEPWSGRPSPRIGPAGGGMLNGIGIQNPGVDAWLEEHGGTVADVPTDVWGSVVAHETGGFAEVARKMESSGIAAIEVNLSCPNLDGDPFALDAVATAQVIASVRAATSLPIGAKLSPDAASISDIAAAASEAGADWVVLTNTVMGAGIDPVTRRPTLSGIVGGYSGEAIRPIALRCVLEVRSVLPDLPIVACGGVSKADHVIEYVLAGADAVAIGTAHFARPRIAAGITKGLHAYGRKHGIERLADLKGAYLPW